MINYGFTKQTDLSFEDAIAKVTEALQKEGFGVLTRIDLKEKFKEKLGVDFRKYTILGACNPGSAYKAIQTEENIGLLLPCNTIVYEKDGKTVVSIVNPMAVMRPIGNDKLCDVAGYVEILLKRVFNSI
jgi:uncharacterized protein (DUF302 family)